MTPTEPVYLLACAIATREGWFSDNPQAIPRVRRNPGDIRYAEQIGATRPDGSAGPVRPGVEPVAVFSTNAMGTTALLRQLWLQVAHGQTVRQIIQQWAPPNENDTSGYLQDVLNWTGLPADVQVLSLLQPLVPLNVPKT